MVMSAFLFGLDLALVSRQILVRLAGERVRLEEPLVHLQQANG